jgi:hypothetical protein
MVEVEKLLISTNLTARNQEFILSTLFTLVAKVQRPLFSKMPTWQFFLTKAMDSLINFGSERNGNLDYGQEAVDLSISLKKTDKILAVRLGGLFWEQGLKWDAPSFFGLWTWPLDAASHYDQLKAPIPIISLAMYF